MLKMNYTLNNFFTTSVQLSYVRLCHVSAFPPSMKCKPCSRFQLWNLFVQLVGHYVVTKGLLLCHNYATSCYICAITGPQYWHCFTIGWPLRCHYLAINKVLLIHYPNKVRIYKLQIGSQCYINYIKKVYIGGTLKYSILYT